MWSTQRASATPKRWAMAPRDSAPRPVRRSPVHAVQYPVASYAIRIERYDVRWAKFLRYAIRIERYDVRWAKFLRAQTSGLVSFGRLRASPRSRARYDSSPFRSAAAARTVRPATTSPRRTVRGGDAKPKRRALPLPSRRRPRAAIRPQCIILGRWVSGDGAANDETRDAMSIHSLYGAGANTFRTHTPDGLPQTRRAGGQCPFGTRRSRSAIDGRPAHRRKGARATLGHRGKPICRSGTGRTVADKSPVLPEG